MVIREILTSNAEIYIFWIQIEIKVDAKFLIQIVRYLQKLHENVANLLNR